MATPGFGFSFGDFISGVSLVRKLIRALNDSAGGRAAYRRLISELLNLDEALTGISNLELEPAQSAEKVALEQVASQCQLSIETFLDKNAKFKDTLGTIFGQPSTAPRWQINLHQVQWALCKDSAIQALRTEIRAHTATLNLLLSTIHISAVKLQNQTVNSCKDLVGKAQNQTDDTLALAKQNHQLLASQSELIVSISSVVAKITHRQEAQTTETSELGSLVTKVMESNVRIFATVLQMQQVLSQLPAQVDRQQPVIFEDAHGRLAPFHVEFINSFAAFQAVLEARFQDVPGLKKVKNREYTMQDVASKKMLDLNKPWESIFRPGRRANMSMVFEYNEAMSSSCPGCLSENTVVGYGAMDEIRCSNQSCGIWYRRVTEVSGIERRPHKSAVGNSADRQKSNTNETRNQLGCYNDDSGTEEENDGVHDFHRVQIVHIVHRQKIATTRVPEEFRTIRNGETPQQVTMKDWNVPQEFDDGASMTDSEYDAMIREEVEQIWVLDHAVRSPNAPDGGKKETFYVKYHEKTVQWRDVTVTVCYSGCPKDSLEEELLYIKARRDRHAIIYEAIRESLIEMRFYDTVTNMDLQTQSGRLHVHVTEGNDVGGL